jgi:hypothetical protein
MLPELRKLPDDVLSFPRAVEKVQHVLSIGTADANLVIVNGVPVYQNRYRCTDPDTLSKS